MEIEFISVKFPSSGIPEFRKSGSPELRVRQNSVKKSVTHCLNWQRWSFFLFSQHFFQIWRVSRRLLHSEQRDVLHGSGKIFTKHHDESFFFFQFFKDFFWFEQFISQLIILYCKNVINCRTSFVIYMHILTVFGIKAYNYIHILRILRQ